MGHFIALKPLFFRFGYPIYLLEQLLGSSANTDVKKNVVYDIGCKLERHVEVWEIFVHFFVVFTYIHAYLSTLTVEDE